MADVKQENPVNNDVNHHFQTIENLQIALKASSDAYQSAREQAKKDRRKYQNEVDRICEVANLKDFKLLEKIKHYEDKFTSQLSPSKTQVTHQAQQTLLEDLPVIQTPVDDAIDTAPNQKNISTQTIKNIDTVSTQTDQDQVVLSNLNKISNLERTVSKMDQNQDLLLSELNLQKRDNIALQAEITIMTKRMAKVTYANNLYHVTLIEQNCALPNEAEHLFSSLSNCGQAEDLHSNSIIQPSKKQGAIFQKVQVDTKTLKKDHHIATLLPLKEDPTQPPKKEANKTLNKELAWISKMSQALTKLEKKFAIPIEKR